VPRPFLLTAKGLVPRLVALLVFLSFEPNYTFNHICDCTFCNFLPTVKKLLSKKHVTLSLPYKLTVPGKWALIAVIEAVKDERAVPKNDK